MVIAGLLGVPFDDELPPQPVRTAKTETRAKKILADEDWFLTRASLRFRSCEMPHWARRVGPKTGDDVLLGFQNLCTAKGA